MGHLELAPKHIFMRFGPPAYFAYIWIFSENMHEFCGRLPDTWEVPNTKGWIFVHYIHHPTPSFSWGWSWLWGSLLFFTLASLIAIFNNKPSVPDLTI
jgi:hypothetical protein